MSVESIKATLKRGWPYALASIIIYLGLAFIPILSEFGFDIYLSSLESAVKGSNPFLDLLVIGPILILLFLLLTLFLGRVVEALGERRISRILATISVTALGVIAMAISSAAIITILYGLAL